jgi:hypothetical protein
MCKSMRKAIVAEARRRRLPVWALLILTDTTTSMEDVQRRMAAIRRPHA